MLQREQGSVGVAIV
jgi:hypothetical protein